jgi:hypothetical protein
MNPSMIYLFNILFYATPVVIVLATIEAGVIAWIKRRYNWRASLASLADALGREYIVYRFLPISLAGPIIGLAWSHRLTTLQIDSALAFGLLFLGWSSSTTGFTAPAIRSAGSGRPMRSITPATSSTSPPPTASAGPAGWAAPASSTRR